eukprot:Nk52_evm3s2587 gene=Nk52_evmTU3s2587
MNALGYIIFVISVIICTVTCSPVPSEPVNHKVSTKLLAKNDNSTSSNGFYTIPFHLKNMKVMLDQGDDTRYTFHQETKPYCTAAHGGDTHEFNAHASETIVNYQCQDTKWHSISFTFDGPFGGDGCFSIHASYDGYINGVRTRDGHSALQFNCGAPSPFSVTITGYGDNHIHEL